MSFISIPARRLVKFTSSAAVLSVVGVTAIAAPGLTPVFDGAFERVPAERESGRSVADHCQVGAQTSLDNWADASAHLKITQEAMNSIVSVRVENARPETLYTIWLMLENGSPLMDAGATALVHSEDLADAVSQIANPSSTAANAFTTDADGNGGLTLSLDYPIVGGAFPFQKMGQIEAMPAVFTNKAPRAIPAVIANARDKKPFTLRLASHCGDNLQNGLVAGKHEPWFDWLAK